MSWFAMMAPAVSAAAKAKGSNGPLAHWVNRAPMPTPAPSAVPALGGLSLGILAQMGSLKGGPSQSFPKADPTMGVQTGSFGAMRRMMAPDGSQRDVPAAHVQHYLGRGGRLA